MEGLRDKTGILLAILAIVFLGPFGGNMILPMFRSLKQTYSADIFLIGLGITFYMIPFSIFQLFSGAISDAIYGRKRVILAGLIIYSAGALGVAVSPSIEEFLAFRALQGTGNALSTPIAMALVGDVFPSEVRGRIMGLVAISTTLGATLGPLFGGLVSPVNWRLGFISIAGMALLFGLLLRRMLMEEVLGEGGGLRGAARLLIYSLTDSKILVIGFMGFSAFFVRIAIFTYLSDVLTLPPYEYSDELIAGYLALAGFGGMLAGFVAGYLTDRIGRWETTLLGFGGFALVIAGFLSDQWANYLTLLVLLQGILATSAITGLNTIVVEVDPERRATASSVYGSFRFFGYALAPALLYPAYVVDLLQGVAFACLCLLLAVLTVGAFAWRKWR